MGSEMCIRDRRKIGFNIHTDGRVDAIIMVPGNIRESIPTAVYRVRFDQETNSLYLDLSEFPNPPSKIYGSVHKDTSRYFKTFETQDVSMGVGLYGLKGTGKTTTMQVIAKTALGMDYPVILIDHAVPLNMLANVFAKIKQNIVVMFDEFDKYYYNSELTEQESAQNGILNILDGSCGGGKKFTVVCANDYDRISQYLKERPGRIRYSKFYNSLRLPEVMEYLKDNYKRGISTKETIQLAIMTKLIPMTYDLLKAYVTESNIHYESILDSIEVISSSKFNKLKTDGIFGGKYSCIECIDQSNQEFLLRINRDYSSYIILKAISKENEFNYKYIDFVEILRGNFSELVINVLDSGFEIEASGVKFKTENHGFYNDTLSDEAIFEQSSRHEKHNPKEKNENDPIEAPIVSFGGGYVRKHDFSNVSIPNSGFSGSRNPT